MRGPGSALYGANAFNGVINIITKTPEEMAASRTNASAFSFLGGHDSNFTETLISGGKASDWAFAFGAGYHKTDGYGERQANQVRDSYSTPIFTADVQKKVKRGNWRFTADNADATADLTAFFFLSDADWHTSSYRLDYSEEGVRSPMMARLFGNFLRLNEKAHPDLKSSTYDFELQQQRDLSAKHNVVYGGNYRNVWIKARLMGDQEHSQDLWSLYLQDEFKAAPQTSLFAGVRLDSHSLYGTNITPRASLVHHLPKEQTLRLSYGTAFRAPTLVDSYFDYTYPVAPGVNGHISGNTDLKPEKVTSIEAGYRKEMRGGYVGLNLFHNRVTDLIETIPTQFAPSPPFPPGVPLQYSTINGRDARAVGFEMESEFHFTKGLRGLFNYSYQDVVDSTHQTVDFSPRNKINFGVMTDLANQFNAYLGAHYVDATVYHMSGQTFSVSPYTRIDARVGYRVGRADHPWNMSLAATNLLNDGHLEFPSASIPGVGVQGIAQSRTYWFMVNGKL